MTADIPTSFSGFTSLYFLHVVNIERRKIPGNEVAETYIHHLHKNEMF